jgi:hypothetical protein
MKNKYSKAKGVKRWETEFQATEIGYAKALWQVSVYTIWKV